MSEKNKYSNPDPQDFTVENLAHKKKNELHSKIYSRPAESVGENSEQSNSSKPHPVTGSIDMKDNDAFEFKEYI